MKTSSLFAILLIAVLAAVAFGVEAQTIDNPKVSVTFNGDKASVTLKSVSISRAITDLVDQSCVAKQTSVIVVDSDGDDAWSLEYDATSKLYTARNYDDLLGGEQFTSITDAKKVLKAAMKDYYAANSNLCFVE
jgi:hypothetical protein